MLANISAILEDIFFPSLLMMDSIFKKSSFLTSSLTFSKMAFWQVVFPPKRKAIPNCKILKMSWRSVALLRVSMSSSATLDLARKFWALMMSFLTDSDSISVLFQF